ncbi:ADP-ribosylglycohydrolase family protein [Kribbella solani]|uniref:ADP-ribosylglycohydrolase n=1 Tax=Kribbella solani TaxID=236067 RepID=A0A841DRM9_9ACTN|nr:ADP-ribosylglycohydrolase [Kribbella solani]
MTPASRRDREVTARVRSSMLWSAWADALGFITELTDERGVKRRAGAPVVAEAIAWKRRVGGRFGVQMPLPAGCYSDDTQLRLAVARAITPRGFDVEAFARVELTVWPAYALGGGRASKAAAANLTKVSTPWFGNFFDGWHAAGGNGAAMRIQPHVWAAARPDRADAHLLEVIADAVTTHGHPRALVGAVFHALCLGHALRHGEVPQPEVWPALLDSTDHAVKLIDEHPQLASVWRPTWEQTTGSPLDLAWRETVEECRELLEPARAVSIDLGLCSGDREAAREVYAAFARQTGLADPATRGSGTATVCAALALAAGFRGDPKGCAIVAANELGTDTDTIATMAAALVGAASASPFTETALDTPYLEHVAARLADIACGGSGEDGFGYPDLLEWTPPRAQLDAVGLVNGQLGLAGIALLDVAPDVVSDGRGGYWRWTHSSLGASFLVKHRDQPKPLADSQRPVDPGRRLQPIKISSKRRATSPENSDSQPMLYETDKVSAAQTATPEADHVADGSMSGLPLGDRSMRGGSPVDVDQILNWVVAHGNDKDQVVRDQALGYAVRRIIETGTLEQLIAFTTALRNRHTHR